MPLATQWRRSGLTAAILLPSLYGLTITRQEHGPLRRSPKFEHPSGTWKMAYPKLPPEAPCSVRLFHIEASNGDGVIRCRSEVHDLTTPPNFSALSYMWGPKTDTVTIEINGDPVEVSRNLGNFLRVLEQRDDWSLLWCDQISIDQTDPQDKKRQLPMMGLIFRRAQSVLACVWDPTLKSQAWEDHFARSRYWTRTWILQELIQAQRIVFFAKPGSPDSTDVDEILTKALVRRENSVFWRIMAFRGLGLTTTPFMELLRQFKRSECDRKHDRIYALLSIAAESSANRLSVEGDYEIPLGALFDSTLEFLQPDPRELLSTARAIANRLELNVQDLRAYTNSAEFPQAWRRDNYSYDLMLDDVSEANIAGRPCKVVCWEDSVVILLDSPGWSDILAFPQELESRLSPDYFGVAFRIRPATSQSDLRITNQAHRSCLLKIDTRQLVNFMYPTAAEAMVIEQESVKWRAAGVQERDGPENQSEGREIASASGQTPIRVRMSKL